MSLLWRKIKRSNKKASKFRYTISCKELLIECAHKWRPESIVVALIHRKRRYETDPRRLEWSFDNLNQAMVLWPESVRIPLQVVTTLFRDQEHDQYEDKEWTLLIEEVTPKGKRRPLAAVSINLRFFITDIPNTRMEAKFKLRPLRKEVTYCTVQFDICSKLLRESDIIDNDRCSVASGISFPEERPSVAAQGGLDSKQIESLTVETDKFATNIKKISDEIEDLNKKSKLEPVVVDADQSISSVNTMPKFTYDATKISDDIHTFASPIVKKQDSTEMDNVHSKNSTTPRTSLPGDESPKLSRKRYISGQNVEEPQTVDLTSAEQVKSLVEDIKALHSTKPPSKSDDYEASQRTEKLRQEARKLLQNAENVAVESKIDEDARKRLQDEYRKLKAHTNSPAPTANELPPVQPLRRTASARSNSGSNTDLRKLDDTPIIPAYGLNSNGTSERHGMSPATSTPVINVFNRVKNYGSMRGQELAESLNQFISPGLEFVDRKQQITIKQANSQQSTPTRKIPSQLEKDLRNCTDPSIELQRINDEIKEIERQGAQIMQKMQNAEHGSLDEQDLLTEHIDLTNRKDALVRRQDYYNMLADLNETKEKLALVKEQINSNGEYAKTHADKQKSDKLMTTLKDLSAREVELTLELDQKIEEEEQAKEQSRQTLERTRNFNRAQQEPLSASKRFINMFRP